MVKDYQKRARNKWDSTNMQIVACKVRKNIANEFMAKAKANGTNANHLLKNFIYEYLGRDEENKR